MAKSSSKPDQAREIENKKSTVPLAEQPTVTRTMPSMRPSQNPPPRAQKPSSDHRTMAVLAMLAMVAGWLIVQNILPAKVLRQQPHGSVMGSEDLSSVARSYDSRVDYYRHTTGWKLNRDRIHAQLLNAKDEDVDDAPSVAPPGSSIMNGVPLTGEPALRSDTHENFAFKNSRQHYPDSGAASQMMRQVEAERLRAEAERNARNQYVREFIENARREGYDVTVDADGNAHLRGVRQKAGSSDLPVESDGESGGEQ